MNQARCGNLAVEGFDAQMAAEDTWDALLSAGVFVEGDFTFAHGTSATLKADAEILYSKHAQLATIMGLFAIFPCVQDADALMYVPSGMRRFMTILGEVLVKPVINTVKVPDAATKYEFMYESEADKQLALGSGNVLIGEDIVSTLGSVAGVRKLLGPDQNVHSLAILLRGTVDPAYQTGLTDHYLLQKRIPTDKHEFKAMLQAEQRA